MSRNLVVGRQYHVKGWNPGATFELVKVMDGDIAYLRTPTKRRKYKVPVTDLVSTKRYKGTLNHQLLTTPQHKLKSKRG